MLFPKPLPNVGVLAVEVVEPNVGRLEPVLPKTEALDVVLPNVLLVPVTGVVVVLPNTAGLATVVPLLLNDGVDVAPRLGNVFAVLPKPVPNIVVVGMVWLSLEPDPNNDGGLVLLRSAVVVEGFLFPNKGVDVVLLKVGTEVEVVVLPNGVLACVEVLPSEVFNDPKGLFMVPVVGRGAAVVTELADPVEELKSVVGKIEVVIVDVPTIVLVEVVGLFVVEPAKLKGALISPDVFDIVGVLKENPPDLSSF